MQMKFFKNQFLFILYFINLIYQTKQQYNIIQSDKVFIKFEQQIWDSSKLGQDEQRNYDFDISQGKFQNIPKIVYSLSTYNSDNDSQQGFLLTTNNLTKTKLSYKLQSIGCTISQLGFNILAIDDPNIDVQQKQLSSGVATTITGTQDILQIAAFIYGFKGTDWSNLKLQYALTKIDSRNYKIQFTNSNVPTVYLNFVIIYQNSYTDIGQLYQYYMNFDTQGQNIGGSNTVSWKTSAQIDKSPVFFGLKDFSLISKGYFGIKILSGQTPEAINKQVVLNYFTWNGYKVNMINGIWMAFTLKTCQSGYTMFLNSTYNACVKSCNSVDHHYNTNPANTKLLYSTTITICQKCNDNCYGCKDGFPNFCTDCLSNMYLNPFTNTCDQQKPTSTFCQVQTVNDQTFQNCQKCDPTCKECNSPNNPKSCTSCNLNTSNKYYYQNQCLSSQPSSTYCDSNFICYSCDPYCASCSNSSNNCQSCKANSYLYQNNCLAKICLSNQYLNPYTNNCDQSQPPSTSCSQITLNASTFYYCQKCDPSCKECSAPGNPNSCTSCDINSTNKYFYNNQCQPSQPPSTYCDGNFICHQCDVNCSTCSGQSSNCQSCVTDKYLYINQCLDIVCQSNEYLNNITKTCLQTKPSGTYCISVTQNGNTFYYCQKCDPSCQECDTPGDQNSCTSCDITSQNKYYYKSQCLPSQPPSTYCNSNFQCQDCDKNCLSCSGSSQNCQSCKDNIYFYQNQCYENPLPGTYCINYTDCKQCDTSCKTCIQTSTNCISCPDQQYLYKNTCQAQKPSGVYCEINQNFFSCIACSNNLCQECQKDDQSKCTSCPSGQFLYKDNCVNTQPDSTYCQNYSCQDCDPSCSSCNGPSNNNCTQCNTSQNRSLVSTVCVCNDGYYEDNYKTCQKCSPTCQTCNGSLDTQCLTCKNYIYQNTCYDTPPPGTYCDSTTKQCNKCDQTCQACSGPSNNNCTQCDSANGLSLTPQNTCVCPDNQFIDNSTGTAAKCTNCDAACKTCSGPNNNNCLSCTNYLFNNQCYEKQPPQTYCDDKKICQQCSQGCNTCEGPNSCKDCMPNFFLDSYNTCQKCYINCLTCNGANSNQCLSCQNLILKPDNSCGCQSGYFVDTSNKSSIQCNKCDSNCQECQGSQPSQCLSCDQSQTNKYLYKNQCLPNQPPLTYCDPNSNICVDCYLTCSSCSGPDQNNCTSCKNGGYLYNGICSVSQPNKTYCDDKQVCKDCNPSCLACKDSPNCTACSQDQYLFDNKCQASQPPNTYCINQDIFKICQQCQQGCSECSSGDKCTQCQKDYFLYKDQCYNKQPDKTYCKDNNCFDCDPSCSQCLGPNNTDCTNCQGDFQLEPLSKQCKCPSGTFNDNSDPGNQYKCSNCITGCSKCNDANSCDECGLSKTTNQKLFLIDNQCFEQQPSNSYCDPINFVCQSCEFKEQPCQKCDQTLQNCISCQSGEYLYKNNCLQQPNNGVYCDKNNICKDCDKNCFNCSQTANQCTECSQGQFLYDNKCYPDQPQGTSCSEINNNIKDTFQNCQVCKASNCLTCNKSAEKCDICIEGSVLDSNSSSCICPEGHYLQKETQKNQCLACKQQNCSQCNNNYCIKCQSGYKQNDLGQCVYCDNKMFANTLGICNLPCKEGCKVCTSQDNCVKQDDTFKNCDVSCQTCTGPSASQCASCSSNTRLFDPINNTCKCVPNFEENGQADCQYVYQVPKQIVNAQSAVGVAQFSITAFTTVTNFIPGISYSLGLMQLLGNFYIRQDQTYSSQASVLSSYTKYNLNSLFQQKLLYPSSSSDTNQKVNRILEQSSNKSIYPINDSEKALMLADRIFFASNSIITLSLIVLIFLVAQAFHQYQIRTKEHFKYMNIIRWNLVLFLIQISSNFMLITLFQCQIAEQRMIDWAFIGIFLILYSFFIGYSFMRVYRNDHQDSAVSILSSGINQEHKFSRFYFVIFEARKLIYCIIITGSKQHLNYAIWSICASQVVFIYIAYKQQIFINKLSNNVLISSEVIFLSIVSVLGVMINMSDISIQKTLATIIVVLMMIYSVITISVLIYVLVQLVRRKCGRREDLIQSTELTKLSAKIQLLNKSFEKNQKIKWSMNPLQKRKTDENCNISSILDQSISNKQIKVLKI
ncbi:zinc finger LSD1 subclass family protein (macronuclear) [Tetrahymena thermophila SB210]|uniref:Zinc finger LSD1 subclass family protein n=1 Tax=Tetrahymena thermophila (strain SB210) TaxID=312017 RepID=Q23C44_TETTS|nr:zinc finger LSD1 subclass family protein [Tetrahymena thermophila SB210]EAR93924.2 zinc finger LSD1 subclass family protein [Tetrahymena thermophila SB210]|eukprot:XP_001014169.2 zinc finger LSD1 subclass family protein [Tetrahymena thermophila SB210]